MLASSRNVMILMKNIVINIYRIFYRSFRLIDFWIISVFCISLLLSIAAQIFALASLNALAFWFKICSHHSFLDYFSMFQPPQKCIYKVGRVAVCFYIQYYLFLPIHLLFLCLHKSSLSLSSHNSSVSCSFYLVSTFQKHMLRLVCY